MANHKSAKKRIRSSEKRREINKRATSKIKTVYKKALATENKEEAEKVYKEAVSVLDRYATKGHLHRNNAARKKANLTKHLNGLTA